MAESDLEYNRKRESLQRYIPFLNNMMTELRAKGNRAPQIAKMQSLHEIITNTKKKLKLETLARCEEVITNIYEKVNGKLRLGKSSSVPESPRSTPQSPSPPRDVLLTKPVTIPTEKITTTSLSQEKRTSPKLTRQKIDVYSNVVISSTATAKIQLPTKLPDLSKPPISLDDLKTLEEDVHLHITDTDYTKKTVDELQEVKKQLQLQLRVEKIKSDSHSQDSVKNSARKLSATTSRSSIESNSKPTIIEKKSSSLIKLKRDEIKFTIKDRNKSSTSKLSSVNLLKDSDLFSNTLAVIDNKLIKENKKVKKVDSKRSSISKEPDGKSKESVRKNSLVENSKASTSSTPSRLADKYNPKPRQKSLESPNEEVQPVVNKVDPRKESFTKTSSNVNIEKKLNIPPTQINPATSVQLPEVLQKIFNTKSIVMDSSSQIGAQTNLYNNADFNSQTIMQNQQNIQYNQTTNFQNSGIINNDRYDQQQYYGGSNYDYAANSNLTGRHTLLPTPIMGNINFPNTQSNFDQSSSIYSQFDQSNNIDHSIYNNSQHYGSSLNNHTPVYGGNSYPNAFDSSASASAYYGSSQTNFIPEQNFQDCTRWNSNNDRRSSDPRNYKEYRERKERQEKELKAQQERETSARKERELKAQQDSQVKDPRLRKDSFSGTSKDLVSSSKNKSDASRDLRISSWGKKEKNSSDSKNPNSRPRGDTNKFDQMYSNTNKSASEGNDGWDNDFWGDTDETAKSSINSAAEKVNTDKVCEVKNFKIPKKTQKEAERDQIEENRWNKSKDKGKSSKNQKNIYNASSRSTNNRQRVLVQISSDESDSNNLKDNSADLIHEISDDNNDDVICTKNPSRISHKSRIDTSRVKVVFKSPNQSLSPERDCAEFVSEYDKEFSKETLVEKETIELNETPSTSGLSKKSTTDDASKESEKTNESESDESCAEIKLFSHYMENILKTVTKKDRSAMISVLEILQDKLGKKKDKNNEEDSAKEKTSKQKKIDEEEPPVVGSTTEENIEEPELNNIQKSNETQVNEITKSSDLDDDATDETDELFKETEKEPEPVVESVSERIKNRKRLPGKKHKTELDMLHEDIQEMFIREGVLTATGKRMCRNLKDDSNPIIEEKDNSSPPDQSKNIRKKPGPKSKTTVKNSSDSLKDVRVIINKIPDEVIATTSVRQLRNRNSKVNYDDDNNRTNESETTEKVNEEINDVEVGSIAESDEENKTNSSTAEETPKSKSKRRKTPRWAVGIIPKTKRRRLNNSENKSDGSAEISFSELSDLADVKRLIEPDKNYYYDFVTKEKLDCRLCNYEGHGIAIHYFKEHPESEILCSRLPPDIALDAIKDYKENKDIFEKIQLGRGNITKNRYSCRICGYDNAVSSGNFYEHVTTHTGEYRHKCALCVYSTASGRSLLQHYNTIHPGEERNTISSSYPQAIIFGYLCGDCNFIQLEKKNVEAHVNLFHSIKHPTILKINMSSIVDPSLLKMITIDNNEDESNKIKTTGNNKPTRRRGTAKINTKSTTEDESDKEPEIKTAETTTPVVRRRRGTFHLLINEGSGDDLDDIITLSSRSSRAAKDKATAKLKTMMENISSEGSPPKKKPSENIEANLKVNEMPQDETVTSKLEVKKLPAEVVEFKQKYEHKSKADLNVFTCKTDFMEQEKQIVEDRLRKMEELNKSFSARPSNMDFINKLSNKLAANNNMDVKEEFKEAAANEKSKNIVEKSSEEEPARLPLPIVELTSSSSSSSIVSKKPILEDKSSLPPHQPNIKFRQDRSNSLFSNMIEKLQGKVNEEASSSAKEDARSESESLTAAAAAAAAATFSMAGLIKIVKHESDITFSCYADGCDFSTTDIIVFKLHCKSAHKNLELTACQCDKCGQVIETTLDTTLLENLFDHFNFAHSDFDQPVIRTRKLSGDKLSAVKQEEAEENLENNKTEEKEKSPPAAAAAAAAESTLPENNPFSFKISNVMSLAGSNLTEEATPPLALINMPAVLPVLKQPSFIVKEAKLTPLELLRPKKSDLALRKFIDTPGELYKCPHFYCPFSTNDRSLLMCHLNGHKCDAAVMVPCVYCDVKTPWEHVPTHIDIRHASCKFACRHCLYRAITKEYVYLHLEEAHHNREFMVIALPVHKAAKRFSVAESKLNMQKICQPYKCICKDPDDAANGVLEYLFETEFVTHLAEAHPENIVLCGYPGCVNRITTSMMPQHWAIFHGVNVFQCAYCEVGSKDIATLFAHFAQTHPNFMPDILVRRNEYLPQDRQLRFTDEAFKLLAHIRKFPNNFSAIIRQRAQRSVKLIHLVNPTCTLDESPMAKVSEVPSASSVSGSSLVLKSATKLTPVSTMQGVLVASTTANAETLYLLPTSAISTTKSLSSVTSIASTNKVLVKTSGSSFAGLVQLEPVKIGNNITIYPEDKNAVDYPTLLTPVNTTQSSLKIGNLTIFPSNGNTREVLPTKTVPNLSDPAWHNNYLADLPAASTNTTTSTTLSVKSPNILRDLVKLAGITAPAEEIPINNITKSSLIGNTVENSKAPSQPSLLGDHQANSKVFGDENECITISDDDLLQSAIQSILDQEDESLNKDDNNLSTNSAASSEPPPLIPLVNNSNKILLSSTEVEHINVPNNNVDDSIQLKKKNSSLNIVDDDNDSSEVPFINNESVDPLLEDPLDITPTLNMSLSPERLIIDENALDPLETDEIIKKPENSLKIINNNRSISLISASDDESDSGHNEKKKRNLLGNQLFRCSICTLSFPNVKTFKLHLSTSLTCRKTGINAFQCTHCDKGVKSTRRLVEHIMTHGIQRFSCSLCTGKFATVGIIKLHMKNKHCITQSSLVPLNPIMADIDADEFILKPSSNNTPKEKEVKLENPLESTENSIYSPDQINDIPIRQIFTTNVKCGLCNYQTKVRVNIIRHLQMHLDEKAVPDSAPVNPVPCLEKNEKMFDKMTNLAASSFTTTTGRMGAAGKSAKEKLDDNSPEFIPSYRRYVCCAPNCAYLCPEEGNLKHHLMALHNDEKHFVCFHCKINIETTDIDYVMKHFKLHGLHLYKCQSCEFVHNLKHKVEKHISDRHGGDLSNVNSITVRSMDSEPIEQQNKEENPSFSSQSAPSAAVSSKLKRPWCCCMCKAKYSTREDMQNHIVKKHNIDTQYKCTLCVFKADDEETCHEHFKEKHPDHDFDIILVYQKVEEEAAKVEVPTPFDTTPLWQRDKPRIRHIRGILFDEPPDIQPVKTQKKVKAATSPQTLKGTGTSPLKDLLKAPNSNRNLSDCIDAVAKGTAEILQAKMIKAEPFSKISENVVDNDNDDDDDDDDIILTTSAAPTIILLESDESDTEKKKKTILKRSGSVLNRRKSIEKILKIESLDENTKMRLSRENLLKEFGPLGSPSNLKQWKCPKCEQFKSKRVADFMFHLYKDFKTYRYRCTDCKDMSISFKYMEQHLRVHPEENEDIIERLPAQPALDTWIQMVIREQSLVIVENSAPIKLRPLTGPTDIQCYFCNEKFMSMPECCEHMVYHWIKMPYSCLYCDCGFYTLFELQDHHKIEHPNERISLTPTGPTLQKAMECVENLKKRSSDSVLDSPILIRKKKRPRLSETSTSSCSFSESSMANEEIEDLPLISTRTSICSNSDDDNNDNVYACDVCVHITKNESEILEHLNSSHKLALRKFHVLSDKGSEQDSAQKFACNICDRIFTELKLRRHFIEDHLGKFKYYKPYKFRCNYCKGKFISVSRLKQHSTRIHTNKKYSYECVIPADDDDAIIIEKNYASEIAKIRRKYCCSICAYTTISSNTMTIRGHVRTHLKPFCCDYCKKQFKYNNEVEAHSAVHHPELQKSSTVLKDTLKELNDRLKIIVAAGVVVEEEDEEEEVDVVDEEDTKEFVKNIARKSTSTPFVRKSISSDNDEEGKGFTFYGVTTKKFELSKIPTTFEIDNMQYSASVEEMMKMINLNTYVDLTDCIVKDA